MQYWFSTEWLTHRRASSDVGESASGGGPALPLSSASWLIGSVSPAGRAPSASSRQRRRMQLGRPVFVRSWRSPASFVVGRRPFFRAVRSG